MNWLLALFNFRLPVAPAEAVCARCRGRSRHPVIPGEGVGVCLPCVYRNGRAAGDPSRLTAGEVEILTTAHGDVVRLQRTQLPFGGAVWRWEWIAEDQVLRESVP